MINNNKAVEIILEVYRELYKAAEPSVDFDAIWRIMEDKPFYMYFYLPQEKQDRIIREVCNKYKLTRTDRKSIEISVFFGAAPLSVKNECSYKD